LGKKKRKLTIRKINEIEIKKENMFKEDAHILYGKEKNTKRNNKRKMRNRRNEE
jgi:hypothetical protein